MNDLTKMIEDTDKMGEINVSKTLNIPLEYITEDVVKKKPEPIIQTKLVETEIFDIETASFPDWFAANHMNLKDIGHVKASVKGVNPRRDLIFKIPDPDGGIFDDEPEFRLRMFTDADKISVLNLPAHYMSVYNNNAFVIMYSIADGKSLTCYGVKTGIIVVFSIRIQRLNIPYAKVKVGKKEKGVNIIEPNISRIESKLDNDANIENLILLYNQIKKFTGAITTTKSAIKWLRERATTVTDVNHFIKIDDAIISLVR